MSYSLFNDVGSVSWVQLFGDNEVSVRHLTLWPICPSISINGVKSAMNMRAKIVDADNNQYTICTKFITLEDRNIIINGQSLPSIPQKINDFIVIGDTGSKLEDFCDKIPLNEILSFNSQIMAHNPDILIHIGDLVYGNRCYEGDKQVKHFSAIIKEFLLPSKNLLSTTPLIIGRGNHDHCKNGNSWLTLFGQKQYESKCSAEEDIYEVHLGEFDLAVFDTSSAPWGKKSYTLDEVTAGRVKYGEFAKLFIEKYNNPIFIAHQPIYSLRDTETLTHEASRAMPYLTEILGEISTQSIKEVTFLSGHYHLCGKIQTGSLTQYISGCSGFDPIYDPHYKLKNHYDYNNQITNSVGSLIVGERGFYKFSLNQESKTFQSVFVSYDPLYLGDIHDQTSSLA